MPIVINEIEINVEVATTSQTGEAGTGSAVASGMSSSQVIRECVEKVLEILNQKNER